jgi:hypothetical protein
MHTRGGGAAAARQVGGAGADEWLHVASKNQNLELIPVIGIIFPSVADLVIETELWYQKVKPTVTNITAVI